MKTFYGTMGGVALLAALGVPIGYAEEAGQELIPMRVEEDWEVVLNEPGESLSAPQFHTIMSPFGDLDSYHFQVCWNYRESPWVQNGGLQVLAWDGEASVGANAFREDALSASAETITWTQVLRTDGSTLVFRIKNGHSQTWSDFGGLETRLTGEAQVSDLSGYTPIAGVANSWVSYGSNRVDLLRIKEIRSYDINGTLISKDTNPRVVFQRQD